MTKLTYLVLVSVFLFVQNICSEITSDTIKTKHINEITVFADVPTNLSFPKVVVNSSQIKNSVYVTAADILQQETGVSIARDGIWSTSINVRGFSEQRILEMVDGDRIQTATEHSGPMSTIDMNTLESIEVIKGAASVLYGTGAMGGVVNFITKTPKYSELPNTKGNVGTEFNSVNNLWANFANMQFTSKQWYLALNGSYRTAQNTMTPDGILTNSQFHDASWGMKASIKYSENQEFKANYQHFEGWNIGIPGGRTFPETASARYTGIARNQLVGEYIITDVNEHLNQINIKAYTQNISRDVELQPANPSLTLYPSSVNKTSGAKITTNWEFDNYQQLILGAEGWVRDAKTIRLTQMNSADTLLTVTADLPSPNAKMYDAGIFAHYSWEFVPSKWSLNAGLRLDYIQIDNDSAFYPLYKFTVKNDIKTYVNNLSRSVTYPASINQNFNYSAHVDLVYNITKAQGLTFSLSNSYRSPSIEELFKNISLLGNTYLGNPDLKAEQGTFSNLNYTILGSRFSLKTDVFANYLTNLIQEEQTTTNSTIYVNQNVSKARFLGAEIEGKWLINSHFNFFANASYTNVKNVDTDIYLTQIPPLNGYAALNYSNKSLGATLSSLWAAKQTEAAPDEPKTDGSVIFNFDIRSAQINFSRSFLKLYAGVNNIFDTAYFNHLSSTRGVIKLEPGRNVFAKIQFGW